jgi:anti-sigma factor RsiW
MTCEEAQEFITGLVDGELTDSERSSLEIHLRGCPSCRAAVEQERLLKQTLHGHAERVTAPASLRDRILADHRVFPKRVAAPWHGHGWRLSRPAGAALAAALTLAIALPVFFRFQSASEPIATAAVEAYDTLAKDGVPAAGTEKPDEIVERLVRAVGGHFHPMGYDLTALHLHPVAGSVREIQGRKVLVVVYQGRGGTLLCYTFVGSDADAPPNSAKFFEPAKKMNLYAFSRGPVNAVLHREGEVICILASEMPMAQLLELTRAKARAS